MQCLRRRAQASAFAVIWLAESAGFLTLVALLLCPVISRAQSVLASPTGVFVAGGSVCTSAFQSDGKLVIAGKFVAINGVPRNNIARLNVDGSVDLTWDPGADTTDYVNCVVSALAVHGNIVYAAGSFDFVGGEPRNRIAALDTATGLATPWDPGTGSPPWITNALAVSTDGSVVFVGGAFGNIGGASRNNLAALAASDGGALPSWSADTDAAVTALAVSGNVLYVAGNFSSIGAQARNYLAAVDIGTGSISNWAPTVDNAVHALAVSGSNLYAGGTFTHVGGNFQPYVVALDVVSGATINWNPGITFYVNSIAISPGTVFLGGGTYGCCGSLTGDLVAADAASGVLQSWNPAPDAAVTSLATSGNTVFAGGFFTNIGGNLTGGFAKIDNVTAESAPLQLSGNAGTVSALQSQSDGKVIVGGTFTAVGGVPRNNLARLNADGSVDALWNPNPDGDVSTLFVYGSNVYVGGSFLNIGSHFRQKLAAVDLSSGVATSWQPDPDYPVSAIAATGNTIFVGGDFGYVGNGMHLYLAALDANTGLASDWNANADGAVTCLAVSGGKLYAGGLFGNIGGQPRRYLASLDVVSGIASTWNPAPDANPNVLLVDGNTVYVGGTFGNIGLAWRQGIAAIDAVSGLATDWNANIDYNGAWVNALAFDSGNLIIGGIFYYMGGQYRPNLAAVDISSGLASSWDAPVSAFQQASVAALAVSGDHVFVGGSFQSVAAVPRGALAAVTSSDVIFGNGFEL